MPQGKGTYGSKVGRPPKRDKYSAAGVVEEGAKGYAGGLLGVPQTQVVVDTLQRSPVSKIPGANSLLGFLDKGLDTVNKVIDKTVETVVPGTASGTGIEKLAGQAGELVGRGQRGTKKAKAKTKKRTGKQEGGPIDEQMDTVMQTETVPSAVETHTMPDGTEMPGATHEEYEASMPDMESDEEMEDNYMDFIIDEALEEQEEDYLMETLEADPRLSMIFDKVFDVASEFAGTGPVNGPGSDISDSIPARLSDGEFVVSAKATDEIGADSLDALMSEAETIADKREAVAYGGYMNRNEDTEYNRRQPLTEEEQLLDMQRANPRRFYRPISG